MIPLDKTNIFIGKFTKCSSSKHDYVTYKITNQILPISQINIYTRYCKRDMVIKYFHTKNIIICSKYMCMTKDCVRHKDFNSDKLANIYIRGERDIINIATSPLVYLNILKDLNNE